ncbi:hypothetical protein AGABI1DRAFT_60805 [Agaricus bisporus var. burnettii JB137-S8]|uniref:Auxin efflux carrier n=1 Tax=Agaricus bisporus var. burnettii (strain JB137-S8 / ATCC MYA-4627 / FGSC 10392) TaxID=597362 RepID=K5XSF6_AGABU|nr:uncharacterized protein AGABI1DRAFT_60805 [Agaricus bisporus var. burnettii JB137-S8]EKM77880.1 hypothetical protein AGABI1DRAFT_60805 [Agaricus bisporus var. burnettii JB137-S8]
MVSALVVSFFGGLQASVSVLLTLCCGFIGARMGMVRSTTARDISALCRNLFLPALLITEVGSQLTLERLHEYTPIFIWSIAYAMTMIAIGEMAVKLFQVPRWTVVAVTFNNTVSLPILLTRSLLETGILTGIADGNVEAAMRRATSYFLMNSFVSKVLTFSIGPLLLHSDSTPSDHVERGVEGGDIDDDEAESCQDERALLLPRTQSTLEPSANIGDKIASTLGFIPLSFIGSLFNPTTWGGVLAAIFGLIPFLHQAAFAPSNQGGFLNAWFTSTLRNIGGLFNGMEMFVVGSKLSDSLDVPPHIPPPRPPRNAVIVIMITRFLVSALMSIGIIYLLAVKTNLLGHDPVLWWSMMLMPIGPPALVLVVLQEVTGVEQRGKMMMARVLAYNYLATPLMAFAIVLALRTTEAALELRSQSFSGVI